MAIQCRRGNYADFDKSKMLPGEWAVVLGADPDGRDGRGIYMCFGGGVVKRIATYEEVLDHIYTAGEDIVEKATVAFDEKMAEYDAAEAVRMVAERERERRFEELIGSGGSGSAVECVDDEAAVAAIEALF